MGKWDGLDRRKFPRVFYPCLVVLKSSAGDKNVILTHTENIGTGGICVILKQNIRIFSPVDVELDLLDLGNHIKCRGKVVWNVQRQSDASAKPMFYDIGVEFEDLGSKDHERLEQVVSRLVANQKTVPYT